MTSDRKRSSSVSFTPGRDDNDKDEIQISLAPYIQNYLAHSRQAAGCCGIGLPIPFERAARQSWWNPKFDSEILEDQYRRSAFPQLRLRFRYALLYILLISLSWLTYFTVTGLENNNPSTWPTSLIIFTTMMITMLSALYLTYTKYYRSNMMATSLVVSSLLCVLSLTFLVLVPPASGLTLVGHFALCGEILLLIYTVIPLPLYASIGLCTLYSILFEVLTANLYYKTTYSSTERNGRTWTIDFNTTLIIRILMQISIHIIGVHILIMTFVRMRGTFMKVGQSLLVRKQLEMEKQLKEKMIHSVMPPKVADWLMEESEREREREDSLKKGSIPSNNTADIRSLFRPFNMHSMEDVSILFADIVGFTRMSSNKTAEELVDILNDLFERFDDLCVQHGCEKISTLGDCYYCVSGCPEPRSDHARCCVEMGLAMIEAINQFDVERREGVNMRVGVHTGTVLCGIVGTKRFKFDVWSNDVTLANKLESTGKPGRVHISEKTLSFLGNEYLTEEGDNVKGIKTYFIKARKVDFLNEFITNVTSPASISPLINARHRLASYNQSKSKHYLHMVTNPNNYKIKANSLPSILDSENDYDEQVNDNDNDNDKKEDVNKSPLSTASYGKKKARRPWRYLHRQRTTGDMDTRPVEAKPEPEAEHNGLNGVVVDGIEMDPNPAPASPLLPRDDVMSHTSSICSRKDSGIRSNSRRSSIQQQLFLMNGIAQGDLLGHRVSGYYTSSSTLNSLQDPPSSAPNFPFPPILTDTFGVCFHKLRKQSDLQLIRCVQDNVSSQSSYFVTPPLSTVTLFFKNKEMEKEYRENAHKASEALGDSPPTLATARFNTYFDILISALVYTAITASLFLLCKPTNYFIVFSVIATLMQILVVVLCIRQLVDPNSIYATYTQMIFKFFTRWYPWHGCGALLVGLPIISILLNLTCNNSYRATLIDFEYYYSYLMFVGLIHFCNFTQLNCWMKNFLVTLSAVLFITLVISNISVSTYLIKNDIYLHNKSINGFYNSKMNLSINEIKRLPRNIISDNPVPIVPVPNDIDQFTDKILLTTTTQSILIVDESTTVPTTTVKSPEKIIISYRSDSYNERLYKQEIFLDIILLLFLVWFLNREFEISYRLSFHGNAVAAGDKTRVQAMKNQADWLLHNIIPKYVADQLKTTAKYSQNHKAVGIIFASIVNFNELYDESYLGGKEYLRVLNELIGDFDELLEKPEFSNVEKIKTIGSTFMAASGLNPQVRQQNDHENCHLFQLIDFAVAMQKVIYDFNRDLLGFKLILRVGFNYGDVTAGVIGATKLYYDIWGDAVNIASRMDSTGVPGRIQFASNCVDVLGEKYKFEPRGQVYVKGKDNMDVFLLIGKKEDINGTGVI
ncbi:adenylate cyclase type 9 [Microplitis demolitor]|uniref:adenylate cyclase type 9 n=1 Tax=Microplitis demolitor TaxID=69319 RepID=UPI0004400131|nr:adenylate cyclase type 9 [Microplitis demolitor]